MSSTMSSEYSSSGVHINKTLSYDNYVKTHTHCEKKFLGVDSDKLMDILGNDLLFFELYKYVSIFQYIIELRLEFKQIDDVILITVLINDDFVKTIQLNKYEKSSMIYQIQKVELNLKNLNKYIQ